ncbi:hypothetical protein HOL83_03680 [Candidatus Woesearchaeota archaeon]|jgi:archaea-specific RecJ-like exonuclease|nr:hypothetical protein [Candidatus Woesearchaeota archaeon]MBT5272410.1 hypothetical protein [Candidatus Woesearchaeota archaeon]MBT6041248.1 hypothetical protein [Candidatus Woesearchaeota archaeon]MBT6336682.1 hypothetical protein [Candidatus Woesearchaeota archaeon]
MTENKFMIKSEILNKLQPRINKVVSLIKQAIESKRPIWIRHHNDTDGYCAAIALERAILPLIHARQTKERDVFYHYSRLPSKAPYYDYADATKDVTNFMNRVTKFEAKPPMIIICDNGSSEQDIKAIKKVKIYGAKVIVIDHHPLCAEIDKITDAHVNPHQVGSVYDISAGMLCAEIARKINSSSEGVNNMELIAAVAGIGDKVKSKELDAYIESCKKSGKEFEFLQDVAKCLDYEGSVLGFMEGRDIVNDLLGANEEKQKKLLALIKPKLKNVRKQQLETNKKYMVIEELEKNRSIIVCRLEINKVRSFGSYPAAGATVGITQDYLVEKYKLKNKKVISLGINKDQINFRCSREIKEFDVNEIIKILKNKLPYAQIDGGGHRVAGSINFVEAAKEEVISIVEEYINKIKQ